jgi:hypothetical protein
LGDQGYKYPQIQNSNSYISEFGTSEKNLGTSDSERTLLTVVRTVGTFEKKLRTSEQGNSRGKNNSRSLPFGCGLGYKKDRL